MKSPGVQRLTSGIVRASLTTLVVGAAALKVAALVGATAVPAFALPSPRGTELLPVVVLLTVTEVAVGIGLWTRWSAQAAAGALGLAVLFSVGFIVETVTGTGSDGCGCLGAVPVSPWSRACMIAGIALGGFQLMRGDDGRADRTHSGTPSS